MLDQTLIAGGQFGAGTATLGVLTADVEALAKLPPVGRPNGAEDAAELLVPMSSTLFDGRSTACDWLLETPDSLQQTAWEDRCYRRRGDGRLRVRRKVMLQQIGLTEI